VINSIVAEDLPRVVQILGTNEQSHPTHPQTRARSAGIVRPDNGLDPGRFQRAFRQIRIDAREECLHDYEFKIAHNIHRNARWLTDRTDRLPWVDVLRGLSILAVVLLHINIRIPFGHSALGSHLLRAVSRVNS
jgi:hypothetical protein